MLNVTLGSIQQHDRLTLFPLIARDAPELPFALMAEALDLGSLRITEVDSGVVGELLAINSGPSPILILDGEQLIGAKQNRTTNRSILLGAASETRIPVSCMEQGRWRDESTHFKPSKHNSPSDVRRKAREVEARHAEMGADAPPQVLASAQGEVWAAIQGKFEQMGAVSETGAMDQIYAQRDVDLTAQAASVPGGRGTGRAARLRRRHAAGDGRDRVPRALREAPRAAADGIPDGRALHPRRVRQTRPDAPQRYLDSVTGARRVPSATAGIGSYAVVTGPVIGGELSAEPGVVHLSAFPAIDTRGGGGRSGPIYSAPISPPSRRRR
jgi:hypothetical protein